jgi:hypothetical protein
MSNILEDTVVAKGCVQTFPGAGDMSFKNIITTVTSSDSLARVKAGSGFLHAVIINTTSAGAITLYNSLGISGAKIGTLKASVVEGTYTYNVPFSIGLTISTASNSDITVVYK